MSDHAPPADSRSSRGRKLMLAALVVSLYVGMPAGVALTITAAAIGIRVARALRRRRQAQRLRETPPRSATSEPQAITVGRDAAGAPVMIPLQALRQHGLIVGATGSGKSTTMLGILRQEIGLGHAVVALDLKGSRQFALDLAAAAQAHGRRFVIWTPDGPSCWNPLTHGNPTELKDKLIATEHFSEPHYKRAAERYLQRALTVFAQTSSRPPDLGDVIALLEPSTLAARAARLEPAAGRDLHSYLASLGPDQRSAVRGLQSRLALLTESQAGQFLTSTAGDRPEIDLRRSMDRGDVVLFSLSASSYGQTAAQLGTMIVQDLVSATGARMGSPFDPLPSTSHRPVTVAIDEFSALSSDHVLALLARGREPGVAVLLATQELADLDRAGPHFRAQLIGNAAVKIAHRQDEPGSARTIAELGGTQKVWERTYRERSGAFGLQAADGATVREVERFRVDPQQIANLGPGEALVMVKTPRPQTTLTRIDPQAGIAPPPRPAERRRIRGVGGRTL